MAEGERRMLFDTRGRRKNVIRVVYAVLALLMGGSLFLAVGPVNIAELIGDSNTIDASKAADERVERLEGQLAAKPNDEGVLLALTRAQVAAGNVQVEPVVAEGEVAQIDNSARKDFEAALQTWNRYLKQAGEEPSATVALLVAGTFFRLAESSTTVNEAQENVERATRAQQIAAEERPSVGSLTTLAIYQYFAGEYAAGDKTAKQAEAKAATKAEAKAIEEQLAEFRKQSKAFQKQKKEAAKLQSESGKEALQNPFGGLGGAPGG
jgi:hypothetical protein